MYQEHHIILEHTQAPPPDDILDPAMVHCHEIKDEKHDEDRELKLKRKASSDDVDRLNKAKLDATSLTSTETE